MRRGLAIAGGVLVAAGAALAVSPDLAPSLPPAVRTPVLAGLGLLVAVVGVAIVTAPDSIGDGEPSPDRDVATAAGPRSASDDLLGAEFDATLARLETMSSLELRRSDEPATIRARLREAAIAAVVASEGVDADAAAGIVDRGEWTDDPAVAALCSSSVRAPIGVRLRERASATPRVVSRARRTAEALEGSR
jgi:hypothetical protein